MILKLQIFIFVTSKIIREMFDCLLLIILYRFYEEGLLSLQDPEAVDMKTS